MENKTDSPQHQPIPVLMHLTHEMNTLAAILASSAVRAKRPFGAVYNHTELSASQRVACFSEIGLEGITRLAERHGGFGLAFHRRLAQARGAAPVWYLPRNSPVQTQFFDVVRQLAFRADPELDHFLWRFTPFIDYPQVEEHGEASRYDWRWEREWRIRGDLLFRPDEVAILLAPESVHDVILEMWLWEALDAVSGLMPPLIDVNWPLERQRDVILEGPTAVTSTVDETVMPFMADAEEDTAPQAIEWVEDEELARREQREEWSDWVAEFERDDI